MDQNSELEDQIINTAKVQLSNIPFGSRLSQGVGGAGGGAELEIRLGLSLAKKTQFSHFQCKYALITLLRFLSEVVFCRQYVPKLTSTRYY